MKNSNDPIKNFVQNTILGSSLYTLMCIALLIFGNYTGIFSILLVCFFILVGFLNTVYLVVKTAKEDK
jgi:preprotein translocase subunit SecF